jgi:hypothetical protein
MLARTRSLLVLLAAMTLVVPAVLAQTRATAPGSLGALIDQTVALFPQIDGDVVDVQGPVLTVVLSSPRDARPGLALEVFREGKEIRHPRTGQVLGKAEQPLGRALVSRVSERFTTATVEGAPADAVRSGDRVRTSVSRVKLVVVTLTSPGVKPSMAEAVTNEIYEGLNRSGRFSVVLGDQIALWVAQQGIAPEEFMKGRGAREAAERFKADQVLAVHLKQVERKPFVDARVFAGAPAEPLLSQAFFVPASIKPAQTAGRFSSSEGSGPAPPERRPRSLLARLLGGDLESGTYSSGESSIPLREVARFPFLVVSMDVAVAPADRIPRLTVSDGERVYVYRIVNRALEAEWTYYARWLGRVISVQLADLDGDGALEVVANRFDTRVGMSSMVLATRGGKAESLIDPTDLILIAVDDEVTGVRKSLWGQRYREESFFHQGQADKYAIRAGKLVKEKSVPVPDRFRATGATFSNLIGKDTRSLVYIDERGHLRIHNGVEEMWRSTSPVGGGTYPIEVFRWSERGGRSFFYQMQPTPLAVDLDGDGIQEVVVPQNHTESGVLAVIFRGPAGLRLQQVNSGFEGIIAGLGAIPGEDGALPVLFAGVVRYKNVLKTVGETQIIMAVQD